VPLALRITLFVLAMLLLVGATSVYVHRRASKVLRLGRRGKVALGLVLGVGPLCMLLARMFEAALPVSVAFALGIVGGTVILGIWISTVLLWAVDLPFWLGGLATRLRKKEPERAQEAEPVADAAREVEAPPVAPVTRREMIRSSATGVALSVGFGAAGYGAIFGRMDYEVPEVPIPIAGLDPALDGYRIAQISDIHFGVYVGDRQLRAGVELIRSARPDLIVLTGDLVDHDAAYAPQLGRMIRQLEQLGARDGVVVIPGNHDYYAGIDEVLGVSRQAGATVLRNDGRVLQDGIALVGVDDVWARRNGYAGGPDLARALAQVPDDLPRVLLCHNPVFFEEARGQVALQMSGHTHGGQVNLGIRPADMLLPYVAGHYREEGSSLYVNRGFGTAGPPARVQAPPEVTVAVLTSA